MISQQSIHRILETVRIEEVIGEYVRLKRSGSNLIGLCPFHNEKTPSFSVSPAKGIYKCFGCGAAGNVVKFIMDHEHYSYPEALRYLAGKYNIEIEEIRTESPQDKIQENRKESLLVLNSFAQKFYTEMLFDPEKGAAGLSYFRERGLRDDTIKKFQLGFAPPQEQSFYQAARSAGFQDELLLASGLVSMRNNRMVDFFRERVLFPIHNFSGRVIGFGGRSLRNNKNIPKYINTPQTEVYDKSHSLFGIFFAKNAIRKADACILVEGYMDVIALSESGIENVVASSGTSLTAEQAHLIRRLTNNILLLYDGDPAGIKAALRGIDILLEEDLNVRIVALPPNADPDSFVRAHGADALKQYMQEHAADFMVFKTKMLLQEIGNDPFQKAEAIRDIVRSIAIIPDALKRALFIKECATLLHTSEQILISEANKIRRNRFSREAQIPRQEVALLHPDIADSHHQPIPTTINFDLQERDVIRLLLEYGHEVIGDAEEGNPSDETVTEMILDDLQGFRFENPLFDKILQEYVQSLQAGIIPDQKHFIHHPDKDISNLAIELLHPAHQVSSNWEKMHDISVTSKQFVYRQDIRSSICRFKLKHIQKKIDDLCQHIKTLTDPEALAQQLKILSRYQEMKKEIASELGTVVIK
ncbi:MAG: DNA primase [Chitinophagales bacterium]|nr:MAG: DNA primase [Chitinophagales bacterium]